MGHDTCRTGVPSDRPRNDDARNPAGVVPGANHLPGAAVRRGAQAANAPGPLALATLAAAWQLRRDRSRHRGLQRGGATTRREGANRRKTAADSSQLERLDSDRSTVAEHFSNALHHFRGAVADADNRIGAHLGSVFDHAVEGVLPCLFAKIGDRVM